MSRKSKDGTFLDDLVRAGLLAAEPLAKPDPDDPPAFQKAYTITPLGKHAAEYGEYEADLAALRGVSTDHQPAKAKRK